MNLLWERMTPYDLFRLAQDHFEKRDYYRAVEVLRHLVDTHPHESELGEARELLVRAYYHSAQTGRAIDEARALLERQPDNGYVALLLTRALERASRPDEARAARRVAEALGAA